MTDDSAEFRMVKAPCRLCERPTPYRFAAGNPVSPACVPCCGKFECEAAVKVEENGGTITKDDSAKGGDR